MLVVGSHQRKATTVQAGKCSWRSKQVGLQEPEGKSGRPVRQEKQALARLGRAGTPGTLGPWKAQRGREEEGRLDTR